MTSKKRPRASPTLLTPQRPRKRLYRRVQEEIGWCRTPSRRMFTHPAQSPVAQTSTSTSVSKPYEWSKDEVGSLIEFMLLHGSQGKCPLQRNPDFWTEAAKFISMRAGLASLRSGIYNVDIHMR